VIARRILVSTPAPAGEGRPGPNPLFATKPSHMLSYPGRIESGRPLSIHKTFLEARHGPREEKPAGIPGERCAGHRRRRRDPFASEIRGARRSEEHTSELQSLAY